MHKNAEASILSACFISEIAITKTLEKLNENDFTTVQHRYIFKAINSLFNKNKPIDLVTTMQEMENLNLDCDRLLINEISDIAMTDNHIDEHIKIVQKHTMRTNTSKITNNIQGQLRENEDIDGIIDYARNQFLGIDQEEQPNIYTAMEGVGLAIEESEKNSKDDTEIGMQSNIFELNRKVIFKKQNLVIIAAKKSVGKSALVNQIVFHNASKGKKGAIIALEGTIEDAYNREIARVGSIDYSDITMGRMDDRELDEYRKTAEKVAEYPVIISTKRGLTFQQIHAKLKRMEMQLKDLDFIVVDYIQKVRTPKNYSRQRELAELSEKLSTMAQEFDCPLFALSQVNHEGITREAEDLENDADIVLKLRRPMFEYRSKFSKNHRKPTLDGDEMPDDFASVHITKNKNGETGEVRLKAVLEYQRFESWDKIH